MGYKRLLPLNVQNRAEEMAPVLRVQAALEEDLSLIPSPNMVVPSHM